MVSVEVTRLLIRWSDGDEAALHALTPLVYDELHRLAKTHLRNERDAHTLQATALVHEAYLSLRKLDRIAWKNKAHFIGIAATTMRRILVDHARRRIAKKRGGIDARILLCNFDVPVSGPDLEITALDEALQKLAKEYPRPARVVELRFFGGLTTEETTEVLRGSDTQISSRTVERDWRFARAWLHNTMTSGVPFPAAPLQENV